MKGIQQEETERTEKIDLKAPFFPGEHRMHPLVEKASALNEREFNRRKRREQRMDLNTPFPLFALVQNRISLGLLINFHEMKVTLAKGRGETNGMGLTTGEHLPVSPYCPKVLFANRGSGALS
jgi:hypothetical protein